MTLAFIAVPCNQLFPVRYAGSLLVAHRGTENTFTKKKAKFLLQRQEKKIKDVKILKTITVTVVFVTTLYLVTEIRELYSISHPKRNKIHSYIVKSYKRCNLPLNTRQKSKRG